MMIAVGYIWQLNVLLSQSQFSELDLEIHSGWICVMKGRQRRETTTHVGIGAAVASASSGTFRL